MFMSRYVSYKLHVAYIEMENHINTFKFEVEEVVDELENSKSSSQMDNGCQEHNNDNKVFHKEHQSASDFG